MIAAALQSEFLFQRYASRRLADVENQTGIARGHVRQRFVDQRIFVDVSDRQELLFAESLVQFQNYKRPA